MDKSLPLCTCSSSSTGIAAKSSLYDRENEILRALFKIIQAANICHFEFDEYLERFENLIRDHLKRREPVGSYNEQLIDDRFAKFLTDVGMYYIRKGNIKKDQNIYWIV